MQRMDAITWVLTTCAPYLRLSQAKTLSELVGAAMRVGRVSLAAIGRAMTGPKQAKHRIKRVWRFVSNPRVVVAEAMEGVIIGLAKRRKKRPLVIALDWTDIRGFCTLMAAAIIRGRSVPLLWASYRKWDLRKSQNNLEQGLLRLLRSLVGDRVKIILLADRGFGRTELARTCQELGLHYVIRIAPTVWVEHPAFRGRLSDYPVCKGMCRILRAVRYRKSKPVRQHVVVRWVTGLATDRDEPWFLMTDLDRSPEALSDLYARRMTVEELFRDLKNKRHGFALRHTLIRRPDRIDRLILILALAYILLAGIGLRARGRWRAGLWCSNNRLRACSVFTIGRHLLDHFSLSPAAAFAAVATALRDVAPNWG
jgi:predicted small integral membrane protein